MKTTYKDPLVPAGEDSDATLRRLSANIDTLTTLIGEAEGSGQFSLVRMFTRSRATKVAEAADLIASATGTVQLVPLLPAGSDVPSLSAARAGRTASHPRDELLVAGPLGGDVETRFLLVGIPSVVTDLASRQLRHQKMPLGLEDETPPPAFARPVSL